MESPTVKSFSSISTCPKCGQSDNSESPYLIKCVLTRYCAGGKEPQENLTESPDPMAQVAGIFTKIASAHSSVGAEQMFSSKLNICAGIGKEHLHKICSCCQFEWLTETKDGGDNGDLS